MIFNFEFFNPETPRVTNKNDPSDPKGRGRFADGELLVPVFYGTSEILQWETEALFGGLDAKRLFTEFCGGNPTDDKNLEHDFLPVLSRLKNEIVNDRLIEAKGMYGFFPVYSNDDTLYLLDPGDFHTEIASLKFPREISTQDRSLVDFFRPDGDFIGVQAVTIGNGIGERSRRYCSEKNDLQSGLYCNGIGDYLTELLDNRVTAEIRRGLFLDRDRGKSFSFGCPGMPEGEAQAMLFEMMGVEERMGITLSPGFQMDPLHSIMAIFVHHPDAHSMSM